MTTGMPLRVALATGTRRAVSSKGASTMPETPREMKFSTSADLVFAVVFFERAFPYYFYV